MITKLAILNYLRRTSSPAMRIRAALFDMDGTLYDSMPFHTQAWHQMMLEIGVDIPQEEFYLHEGRTGAATIDLLLQRTLGRKAKPGEAEELYRRKTEIFASIAHVEPMPGALEALQFLVGLGVQPVLVTGSGQATLIDRLNKDFPGIFKPELMVTSRNVTHGKPHPEPYIKGMKLASVAPWEAIAIENAPLGVESAHRAEVFTIGLTTGPIPTKNLEDAGADIVYPSMQAFADDLPMLIYASLTNMNNFN